MNITILFFKHPLPQQKPVLVQIQSSIIIWYIFPWYDWCGVSLILSWKQAKTNKIVAKTHFSRRLAREEDYTLWGYEDILKNWNSKNVNFACLVTRERSRSGGMGRGWGELKLCVISVSRKLLRKFYKFCVCLQSLMQRMNHQIITNATLCNSKCLLKFLLYVKKHIYLTK